jgi:signal transduction histidine kinase
MTDAQPINRANSTDSVDSVDSLDSGDSDTGLVSEAPTRTREPTLYGRLAVERRMLGLLALLGVLHVGWLSIWLGLALEPESVATLLDTAAPTLLVALLVALFGNLVHVALRMPTLRWPADHPGPNSLPMALAGFPSLLLWPLLAARDRQATVEREQPGQEIELAFRELLSLPRVAASSLLLWYGAATIATAFVLARHSSIEPGPLLVSISLSLASLLPLVSLAATRIRAMLVPEYLTAPRPNPLALPVQRSLVLRLGGPAGLALLGAVLVPALAGSLWAERLAKLEARDAALRDAAALLRAAASDDLVGVAGMLATDPALGLRDAETQRGAFPNSDASGLVDTDGDGVPDHLITVSRDHPQLSASIRLPTRQPTPIATELAIIGLGLFAGVAALALLLRDIERDLGRASRQITAVANGEVPEPMAVETFATAELRGLVATVDRLVGRITDANVYKYVLIEKGHEADRLKSQFLANMSHDLRSPLNSVLGFSELLTTGIEGELAADQLEMIGTIHRTGKDLLQQIDDILDTAKIEAGRMELHREPTPPATLIARAIQRARVRVGNPIEFDTVFAPGLPPAFVDPYRTLQALENVLLFAAEGLQRGTIEISCEAQRDAHVGRVIVIGISSPRALVPLAELEQARRGFFRLPGHTGLGLGLPIATSILELQGGALTIEGGADTSLSGHAAMGFELRLPALTARKVARLRF